MCIKNTCFFEYFLTFGFYYTSLLNFKIKFKYIEFIYFSAKYFIHNKYIFNINYILL